MNNYPLSKLQNFILDLVKKQGSVDYLDVLTKYYGFYPSRYAGVDALRGMRVDRRQLHTRRVCINKSFNRLLARGLVTRIYGHGGVELNVLSLEKSG